MKKKMTTNGQVQDNQANKPRHVICVNCGKAITNTSPLCSKGISIGSKPATHVIDIEHLNYLADNITNEYMREIATREKKSDDNLDLIKLYLKDVFDQGIMKVVNEKYDEEQKQTEERSKLSKQFTGEELKKKISEYDDEHGFLFFKRIKRSIYPLLSNITSKEELLESDVIQEMIDDISNNVVKAYIVNSITSNLYLNFLRITTGIYFNTSDKYYLGLFKRGFIRNFEQVFDDSRDAIKIDQLMSPSKIEEIVREHIVYEIIESNEKARATFEANLAEYRNSRNSGYEIFQRVIKHFVKVKCLKSQDADSYINYGSADLDFTTGSDEHFATYIRETMNMQHSHNLDYNFNLPEIVTRYQYSIKSASGRKEGIRYVKHRGFVSEMFDFFQLYKEITISDDIRWVVYKDKETVHVKTKLNISEVTTNEYAEHLTIYFKDESMISFDLYTSKCYVSGTAEQTDRIINYVHDLGYDLYDPMFKSFKGLMVVTSKAIFSKRIFQELLKYHCLSRYWYTRGQITSNNFVFVYRDTNQEVMSTNTNEYIQLGIHYIGKLNMLDNEWKFQFEGNRFDYLVPFIAMTLSLVHFASNLIYNTNFAGYLKAEREILSFYTKRTQRNNTRKSTDISLTAIAQRTIAKREVNSNAIAKVLRYVGWTEDQLTYNLNREKPFLFHYFPPEDTETTNKWIKFFEQAAKQQVRLLKRANTPKSVIKNCEVTIEDDEIVIHVKRADGTRFSDLIGVRYRDSKGKYDYYLTYYPEKSNVFGIEQVDGRWSRQAAIREKTNIQHCFTQPVRLRDQIPAQTGNVITHFTNEQPTKISFFKPYSFDDGIVLEHLIHKYGDVQVILALCKQHTWDMTDQEVLNSLEVFNMRLHQDLIQNYLQTTILYFEYDDKRREYKLSAPRHKYWYSQNTNYEHVTFVFKTDKGMYEVIYFGDVTKVGKAARANYRHLPVAKLLSLDIFKQYNKTFDITSHSEYIKRSQDLGQMISDGAVVEQVQTKKPITYSRLCATQVSRGWCFDGQMFDSNGKSIGVRLMKNDMIVDLRYAPQYPIMGRTNHYELRLVNDSRTNTTHIPSNLNDEYEVVPICTRRVKYSISRLSGQYENRRSMLYIMCRMIITHWIMYRTTMTKQDDNDDDSGEPHDMEEMITTYLNCYIKAVRQNSHNSQLIDQTVIPVFFDLETQTHIHFEKYLAEVIPNYFHDNAFRVLPSDVESFKAYMRREFEIIVNMRDEYYRAFANARMHTIVTAKQDGEIIDSRNIAELQVVSQIHELLTDQKHFIFSPKFSVLHDVKIKKGSAEQPKDTPETKQIVTRNTITKTELLVTKVNDQFYIIRFTDNGELETAVYVCDVWKKYHKLCSFWETESMIGAKRIFVIEDDHIVESSSNNLAEIELSGTDYHILKYKRDTMTAFAAMLPIEPV